MEPYLNRSIFRRHCCACDFQPTVHHLGAESQEVRGIDHPGLAGMAFQDSWGDETEEKERPPIFPWVVVMAGGLLLGSLCFLMVLPGGPLSPVIEAALRPTQTESTTPNAATPQVTSTACTTPASDPPSTVKAFVERLNANDYRAAWSQLDPAYQQSQYQNSAGSFTEDWANHGRIDLGQMTYRTPDDSSVILLADLTFEDGNRTTMRLQFQIGASLDRCDWVIQRVDFPGESGSVIPTAQAGS
jgi:hypothetical protein